MKDIFVNKSYWENFNQNQLNEFADRIFQHYRSTGFPFYSTDKDFRMKEYTKFQNYNIDNIIKDDVVLQTMHGLGLCWSYFPHAFKVNSANKMSPYDAFMNDEIFMKVIKKRLSMGTYISDSGILKMLKLFSGVQGVANFRPSAAAGIYRMFAPNGVVWDMSGGWGGRMLGADRARVKKYFASEPSTLTVDGLHELSSNMRYGDPEIYCSGSEETLMDKESLDLCFTSPPYFDLEKYSDEQTQSYLKYPEKDQWVEGFLRKTFENCYYGLKNGKHMLINIADPKKKKGISLEDETIRVAVECGFKHVNTMKLALSNPNMNNKKSAFKYEPIFIFKK